MDYTTNVFFIDRLRFTLLTTEPFLWLGFIEGKSKHGAQHIIVQLEEVLINFYSMYVAGLRQISL